VKVVVTSSKGRIGESGRSLLPATTIRLTVYIDIHSYSCVYTSIHTYIILVCVCVFVKKEGMTGDAQTNHDDPCVVILRHKTNPVPFLPFTLFDPSFIYSFFPSWSRESESLLVYSTSFVYLLLLSLLSLLPCVPRRWYGYFSEQTHQKSVCI